MKFKVEVPPKPNFQKLLYEYMNAKNKYGPEMYGGIRRNHMTPIDAKLFSKIIQPGYKPSKATIIIICFLLELDLEESTLLLESCDYCFETKYWFDAIAKTYIVNKVYDLYDFDNYLKSKNVESIRDGNKRKHRLEYRD